MSQTALGVMNSFYQQEAKQALHTLPLQVSRECAWGGDQAGCGNWEERLWGEVPLLTQKLIPQASAELSM